MPVAIYPRTPLGCEESLGLVDQGSRASRLPLANFHAPFQGDRDQFPGVLCFGFLEMRTRFLAHDWLA
jgi:hypothetical protein